MFLNRVFFLSIIFLLSNSGTRANTYYFSSTKGADSRNSSQAQNPSTPWKTIARLNSFFSNLKAGDSVLFKRGETFNGTIEVTRSGSSSFPIVFGAYGPGPLPVISGLTPVSSWREFSPGIWKGVASSPLPEMRMLVLNGVQQPMGRYPNAGYLSYSSHVGNTAIKCDPSTAMPDWRGAGIVIRKNRWVLDRGRIGSHEGGTITYTGGSKDMPTDGYGYFIQNDLRTLDRPGEWYFDPSTREVYVFFGNRGPHEGKVMVSDQEFLVVIDGQRFVKFGDLAFEGAGVSAFTILNSQNISMRDCRIDLSATDAVRAAGSSHLTIGNCRIDHSQNDAINLDMGCNFASVRQNIIRNTGLMAGMGESGTGSYQAISVFGDSSLVEGNEIDSTGYNALYFGGNSTTVKNNRIAYFCCVKDDGAGIYVGDWRVTIRKRIVGNWVSKGVGAPLGTRQTGPGPPVEGIYIDDNSASVDIAANSVSDCPDAGIKIHNAHEVNIEGNTLSNNGIQLLIAEDTFSSHSAVRNILCSRNSFFCRSAGQLCLNMISTADDLDLFARLDDNSYFRRGGNPEVIRLVSKIWSASSLTMKLSLSQWREMYKQDGRSRWAAGLSL
ncbi:MAG TPA: right-handed parallel beta-helix repeat-containing protein [Puia sp.]|nr:right-handed parallel beta-helix repeat-containing protein [Puia sp.]